MGDILRKICTERSEYYQSIKSKIPISELEGRLFAAPEVRGFERALRRASEHGYGLIAEIKKASPSAGLIRTPFEPDLIARDYEAGGATCLSVLTESTNFQGSDDYLIIARKACMLPILRKDFILEPYQVVESRVIGADCILLILCCLSDGQALELEALAMDLGMDVLIEVHNEKEIERSFSLKSNLIGINNRDLKSFKVDISITKKLCQKLTQSKLVVSESGIKTVNDIKEISRYGTRCFLVGESLMRSPNIKEATHNLLAHRQKES